MNLLISTNMYSAKELKRAFPYLEAFPGKIGLEIFPQFQKAEFEEALREALPVLEKVCISFHSPYYEAEYSAERGTPVYQKTMEMMKKTLEYSRLLNSRYVVFHHNNCRVLPEKKEEMLRISGENFREIKALAQTYGIPVAVENAGVECSGTMLLAQEEFIRLCKEEKVPVLIDIGHAHANGWNLEETVRELKNQIVAYHLHNNDGIHDSHQRIHNGTLDFGRFLEVCMECTPNADMVLEYAENVADDENGIMEDIREMLVSCIEKGEKSDD